MPLSQAHKDALTAFEAAQKNLNQFLAEKGNELHTPRVYAEGQQLRENVKTLKADLERHAGAEEIRRDATQFGEFLNSADRKSLDQAAARPFGVIGTAPAGHVVVDTSSRRYLEDVGPGTFSQKSWDAIQDPAYAKAFGEMLRKGQRMSDWAYKNLELGMDPSAGYLAPVDWQARMIERQATPTRLAGMVTNINTARDAVLMPKVNYSSAADDSTGNLYNTPFRATWTGENPTSDTQAQVNDASLFGTVRVDVFTAMIEGVLTNDMVEDGAFNVQSWSEGKFSLTEGLLRDNMILNGTGNQQPTGLAASVGTWSAGAAVTADGQIPVVQTAGAGAVAGDDLINLAYDVPEQYEDNLGWVFNKTKTMKAIRTLKDSQNRYLFGNGTGDSGLVAGKPTDLVGYKYQYSGFAPNIATGKTPIYFGDLMGYYMANRIGFYVQVLREVAARRNQIILLGRVRFGGLPVEPWRLRALLVQ
jgi:HK97 family phage major capsid protein